MAAITYVLQWKVAVKVIRFGLEVASHLAVAVISHIGMFIALVQAAMDEQWIEVPNLGIEKKVKLFQKLVLDWMSFMNLYHDVVSIPPKVVPRMGKNRGMKILKVCNTTAIMKGMKIKTEAVHPCREPQEQRKTPLVKLKKKIPTH